MILFVLIMTLLALSSCQANEDKKNVSSENIISKKYFVKGMTCGGVFLELKWPSVSQKHSK